MKKKSERAKKRKSPEKKPEQTTAQSQRHSKRKKTAASSSEQDESGAEDSKLSMESSKQDTEKEQSSVCGTTTQVDGASTSNIKHKSKLKSSRSSKKHKRSLFTGKEKKTRQGQSDKSSEWQEDSSFWEDDSRKSSELETGKDESSIQDEKQKLRRVEVEDTPKLLGHNEKHENVQHENSYVNGNDYESGNQEKQLDAVERNKISNHLQMPVSNEGTEQDPTEEINMYYEVQEVVCEYSVTESKVNIAETLDPVRELTVADDALTHGEERELMQSSCEFQVPEDEENRGESSEIKEENPADIQAGSSVVEPDEKVICSDQVIDAFTRSNSIENNISETIDSEKQSNPMHFEKDANDDSNVLVITSDVPLTDETSEIMSSCSLDSEGKHEVPSECHESNNDCLGEHFEQRKSVMKENEVAESQTGPERIENDVEVRESNVESCSPLEHENKVSEHHNQKCSEIASSSYKLRGIFKIKTCNSQKQERIFLRRSFANKKISEQEKTADNSERVGNVSCVVNGDEGDKEGHLKNISESNETVDSMQANLPRKRKWGHCNSIRSSKKCMLSISNKSLKSLIPDVKPVPISEVQLMLGEVVEEPETIESEGEIDKETLPTDVNGDFSPEKEVPVSLPETLSINTSDDDRSKKVEAKKIVLSDDVRMLQKPPSPPKHKVTNVLFIINLVRPFTLNQLKELLSRTGKIVEVWLDKIKSKCYVEYETDLEAKETRYALHGVRWPVSNPKKLCVDFGKKKDMEQAKAAAELEKEPSKVEQPLEEWLPNEVKKKDRDRPLQEKIREAEREWTRVSERTHKTHNDPIDTEHKKEVVVREWDLGKLEYGFPDEREVHYNEKRESERKLHKEKGHRIRSGSPDVPARKSQRKEEIPPAKVLDELFRKTTTTPCIYWLPLSAEQIVVKEEMRRRHMAENERQMAAMRKAEKARAHYHLQRRLSERERRRRHAEQSNGRY